MTKKDQSVLFRTIATIVGSAIGAGIAIALLMLLRPDREAGFLGGYELDDGGFALFQSGSLVGLAHRDNDWSSGDAEENFYLFENINSGPATLNMSDISSSPLKVTGYEWPGVSTYSISIDYMPLKALDHGMIKVLAETVRLSPGFSVYHDKATVVHVVGWEL